MAIDTSRQLTKCAKCNHGRWADDLTPCKGCNPVARNYKPISLPLTDSEINAITEKNKALNRLQRKTIRGTTKRKIPAMTGDEEYDRWLRTYFYPNKRGEA